MIYADRPALKGPLKSGNEQFNALRDAFTHLDKCGDGGDWRFPVSDVYADVEDGLNVAFVFAGTNIAGVCTHFPLTEPSGWVAYEHGPFVYPSGDGVGAPPSSTKHIVKFDEGKRRRCHGQDDDFVFVGDVHGVDGVKYLIPTRIWLHPVDFLDDLFSSEIYLSARNGAYKGFRSAGEGELYVLRAGGFGSNHCEDGMIESASQVMNGVADNKRELMWNGFLNLNEVGFPCGFTVACGGEVYRRLR